MNVKIFLLFIVLISLGAKGQVFNHDLKFNSTVITQLNDPLLAALDRHLEVIKTNNFNIENDFFILVSIGPGIGDWEIPKKVHDSIYAKNDFKTVFPVDSVTPNYYINIFLASKKYLTNGWSRFDPEKNVFYYNYNNYDVLLSSNLDLIFNSKGEKRKFEIHLIYDENYVPYSSYQFGTTYSMWNRYITEIRMKDLIWPTWTGNRNEF